MLSFQFSDSFQFFNWVIQGVLRNVHEKFVLWKTLHVFQYILHQNKFLLILFSINSLKPLLMLPCYNTVRVLYEFWILTIHRIRRFHFLSQLQIFIWLIIPIFMQNIFIWCIPICLFLKSNTIKASKSFSSPLFANYLWYIIRKVIFWKRLLLHQHV